MKIPNEDFTDESLAIDDTLEMMLEVVMGVVYMEVDKVADMVVNMKVDKVADMLNLDSRYLMNATDVTGNW